MGIDFQSNIIVINVTLTYKYWVRIDPFKGIVYVQKLLMTSYYLLYYYDVRTGLKYTS